MPVELEESNVVCFLDLLICFFLLDLEDRLNKMEIVR